MLSIPDLIHRCMEQTTDAQSRAMLQDTLQKLQTLPQNGAAMTVTSDCAANIEQAAAAAQRGDKAQAMAIMQQILATPEGAALAQQLSFLLRQ